MPVLALTNFPAVASQSVLATIWQWHLSVLQSCHIIAGYASFGTDQFHSNGMFVSFSYYLKLTRPMGNVEFSYLSFDPGLSSEIAETTMFSQKKRKLA